MKKMIINENQKGFLFKNGKCIKLLDAGKYHLFGGKEIEISNLEQPIVCNRCALETLLADKAIADQVAVVEVGDEELALHYVNGKFSSVLRHGKYACKVTSSECLNQSFTAVHEDIPKCMPEEFLHLEPVKLDIRGFESHRMQL